MNDRKSQKAIVVTPTIGTAQLRDAVASIHNQRYKDVLHLIVVDGELFEHNTNEMLKTFDTRRYKKIVLPFNTANGIEGSKFNGHRIYAACSYLINAAYVFFLDEDNWYDSNHVSSLIQLMQDEKLDWAYSLRKIYSSKGMFITNDDCENLGKWPSFSGYLNLVDTNCYAIKREVLAKVGHVWYHPLGADRVFFKKISSEFHKFKTSSLYTVNYRLHDNRPPTADFFLAGNRHMLKKYDNNLPWRGLPEGTKH